MWQREMFTKRSGKKRECHGLNFVPPRFVFEIPIPNAAVFGDRAF